MIVQSKGDTENPAYKGHIKRVSNQIIKFIVMKNKKDFLFETFSNAKMETHEISKIVGGAWDTTAKSVRNDEHGSKIYRDDSSSGAVEHWESDAPD